MHQNLRSHLHKNETSGVLFRGVIIVKNLYFLILFSLSLSAAAAAQFPQMRTLDERLQQKTEEVNRTEQERKELESRNKTAPAIKPANMNVDVQMVMAKLEYKNFVAAKPFNVTRITDGDPLWLYVKFNGKLGDYVHTVPTADGTNRYLLYVEYGPQGDVTAKNHQVIEFSKPELALTEIKMSLAPGKAGNNNALAIFIKNMAMSKPGLWTNELRISRTAGFPRGNNDYLAKAGFTTDFSKGLAKYPSMLPTFKSMVLRDTTDESVLPLEGKFDNTLARTALVEKLASEGIVPSRVYFSGDNWLEYSDIPMAVRQYRTVTGVFTYQRENTCYYGTAEITQPYDQMNDAFGDSTITLRKDILTPCIVK